MSHKGLVVAVAALLLWGAPASGVFAQADFQRETLRGLAGVWVVVEKLNPAIAQGGLTQSQVQTDIESRLRQAGITVLTQEECWNTPGMPWLYITVALLKASEAAYAATVGVSLNQEIVLARDPNVKVFGVTWDAGVHVGVVGVDQLPTVRETVGGLVDKFVNDYLAKNPKTKK